MAGEMRTGKFLLKTTTYGVLQRFPAVRKVVQGSRQRKYVVPLPHCLTKTTWRTFIG
jgi:hypothetical protein